MTFRSLTAALLVVSCLQHHVEAGRVRRDPVIPSDERFNFFDFELLQGMAESSTGNVVVSPVSVKATLAMLLEAAGGRTAEEIQTALRIPGGRSAQVFLKAYLSSFKDRSSGYKLELSNRVFTSKTLTTSQRYAEALQHYYYADVESIDFSRPERAATNINKWVRNVTRGLIPELVSAGSLNPSTQALVANAVYFKGVWKVAFPPANTQPRCFQPRPGVCINADMMNEMEEFRYGYISKLDAHAVELPYKGDKFAMLLLLPKSVSGIEQLVHDISHSQMSDIVNSMETTEVLLSIPRFTIDFNADLVEALRDLNIREVFSPNSNLTGMFSGTETTATVSNIFHKAKIIVNEEGSEAAAGTGALVVPLMGTSIQTFRADHPFLFFIRDVTTNAVLFAGRMTEPEVARPRPQELDLQAIYPPPTPTRRKPSTTEGYYPVRPQTQTQATPLRPITAQSSQIHPDSVQSQYQNTNQQRPVDRPASNGNPSQTQYQNTNQQRPVDRPTSNGNPSQTQYQNTNQQRPVDRSTSNSNPSQTQYQNTNQQRPVDRPTSNGNPSQTQYQNTNQHQQPVESVLNDQQQNNYQPNGHNGQLPSQISAPISELQLSGHRQVPLGLSAIQPQEYIPQPAYSIPNPDTRFVQNNEDTYRKAEGVYQHTPPPAYHYPFYTTANSLQGRVVTQSSAPSYVDTVGTRLVYQQPHGHNADAIVFAQRVHTDK